MLGVDELILYSYNSSTPTPRHPSPNQRTNEEKSDRYSYNGML